MTAPPLSSELAQARLRFLQLVAEVRPELHRYCARLTGSVIDGEDVVQDALAKVFYEVSLSPELPPLRPLLFRVAHNAAIDLLRRYERRHVDALEELPEGFEPSEEPDPAAVRAGLSAFVALPIRQRSAVILKDVLGQSLEEISEVTGLSLPAVKSALVRGREALRSQSASPPDAAPVMDEGLRERLNQYATLFNARDWEGLRGLLGEECRLELVSQARRQGPGVRGYFGRYADLPPVRIVPGTLEGRPALAVHEPAAAEAPAYFILLDWEGGRVQEIRDYRYAQYVAHDAAFQPFS